MAEIDTAPRVKRQASPAAVTDKIRTEPLVDAAEYMSGFGNSFETEALPGALPIGRNSPQKINYGLYAEQLSGSPFTAPQATNQRSWLYRIRPTVRHTGRFKKIDRGLIRTAPERDDADLPLGQLRWSPTPIPKSKLTFVTGLQTVTVAGDCESMSGMAAHVLLVTESMVREHFFNADGELLIVAQQGALALPHRIRADRDRARRNLRDPARRHLPCRTRRRSGARLCLRELRWRLHAAGSRADRRQLSRQSARLPDAGRCVRGCRGALYAFVKWGGEMFETKLPHSPLDVVAWHGNYAPYKYNLRHFSPVGSILFDHPDPSIFTVLTSPSETPGTANIDFVIFPGALGRRREHLPAALVSPQHHVGIHGTGLRRV